MVRKEIILIIGVAKRRSSLVVTLFREFNQKISKISSFLDSELMLRNDEDGQRQRRDLREGKEKRNRVEIGWDDEKRRRNEVR